MVNNFTKNHISSTVGQYVIAASVLVITPNINLDGEPSNSLESKSYIQQNHGVTFDNYSNFIKTEFLSRDNSFEKTIQNFYATLLASQESLGEEFEKALPKSFWDFYEP